MKILFLCTGNSCRSQMAEGWARHVWSPMLEVYSAGIEAHGLNADAVRVMAETGVDISRHRSKHLRELAHVAFDYVITVCGHAQEHCPVFPQAVRKLHAGFDDPPRLAAGAVEDEARLAPYRRVRDEIRAFVESLPERLPGLGIVRKSCQARNGAPFAVRSARADDAAALLEYVRAMAADTEFFVLQADEFPELSQEREWIEGHLNHPGKLLLVAEAEGTIIGNVSFAAGAARRIAHRGNLGLAVAPSWRRLGVGAALMETLLQWAAASPGIEKVCLEVFVENRPAIALYRRLGFVEEGWRPREIKFAPRKYTDVLAMYRFVKPEGSAGY